MFNSLGQTGNLGSAGTDSNYTNFFLNQSEILPSHRPDDAEHDWLMELVIG